MLQDGSTIHAACICRGDWRHYKNKYHGGCTYWKKNPTGTQIKCEKECEDADFGRNVSFRTDIKDHESSEAISEEGACKMGCKITGMFL